MECLLPSEIARLVFGYLEDQKCDEAAQCFLEHSTFLSECLNVVRAGRKFSSRVQGSCLLDILDEYCAVQSLVAERIRKLPESSSEQLQNCGGLVEKLKILLDNAKSGQTVAVSISVLPHGGASQGNGTQGTLHNRSRAAQSAHERKRSIRFQGQEIKQKAKEREERNVALECSVETTRLETLPGLSGQGSSRSAQTISDRALHPLSRTNESTFHISENISARTNGEEIFYSNFSSEQFSSEKGRSHSFSSTSTIPDKDAGQDVNVNICEVGTSTNTCSKRKTHNKKKCTPSKSSPRVRKSLRGDEEEEDEEEEEESVAATLHRALLNNTELHEKIAENINSVIRIPNDLGSNEMSCGPIGSEDCEGVIQELNNAIKMVVDKTQEDPVFERLLEEIIGPTDEDMSSSPTGVESETDDACDAPDALVCDEDFIISKSEGNSDRNSAVVTTLSQHSLTIVSEGNQKSVVNSLVETSTVVSSLNAVQNVVSDKGKCENHEVPVTLNNVDENIQANSELLPINNKSLRVNVEKLSKKSCQQASQSKGKSSASSNVTLAENDGSAVLSIHKEVRALLENVPSDTVSAPKSDIPLKQRLRSARKSDNNLQGTTKETSSVDRSLEDQNAKAIQLILEANKKSSQLLETENIGNSNDEVSSKEVNKSSSSISPKKISDVPEKSNDNNEKDVITRDKSAREESQDAASATGVAGSETSVDINPAEELNNALSFDNFADKPTQNSVLVEERCDIIQQTNVEKEQIMMLTIPSVMNPNASTSSIISQSQTEQLTTRTSVTSVPQTSYHETSNLQKQVMFSQQQSSEHLPSPFSVLNLSQNVNDAAEGSTKQMIMDETNSSAVIVCDSNMTFPSFQFLKGADAKENQPKKMRPIAPRPIRPKPATSAFPLQLITTDITPQYFVTQVSPTPLLERRNIIPPLSPGLLNVLNLTVPVISQTNDPVKKICICASEDCGKECVEITDKNINLVLSTVGTNSDLYGDSDISSVSEHVPDNPENDRTNKEAVVDTAHQSTSNVCESNNNNFDGPSTSSNANQPSQQLTTTSSKSKHNQVEIPDMSSLLLLPEQMPKPRDTPQEFIAGKSGANTRRLSLSTPRRRTSHIRALDFGTPQKSGTESLALKKSQTSPKPSSKTNIEGNGAISKVGFSTSPYKPSNKQVRSVRSSLFTSPDPPVDKKDGKKSSKENSNNPHVVPIATRSPVTHLLGDWDKATGVGLIFNGVSPENSATRKADHRPSRITPKTLLFSPESESNSASDQNQTPPSQNISDTNKNSDNDLKHTESNEPMKSLPDIETKNNDLNILGQKVSPNTMSIKQKLKTRSWDEDLRLLLSKDFEDVYVQKYSLGKETHNSVLKNKGTAKTCKKDQAPKKLKKRNVKKTNRKNSSDDEGRSALNASELKNKQLNRVGPEEKEVDSTNTQDNASSRQNDNECANLQTEKDKSPSVEEHKNNCSDAPSDIKSNNVSRKRKADEKPENCLSKRPKPASKEENRVGKTVEDVLESMFREDNENSSDKDARPKEKETNKFVKKTRNVCDVLVDLNSTQDVTETSKAPLQTETRDNSNRSIFDVEDNGEETQRPLKKSGEPEISCKAAKVNCDVIKDNLGTESSQLPVNRTAITTETSQSLEKPSKITDQNNSLSASKKAGTNLEKNINLETPIKSDMKYLSKNLNPTTPGPVDGLFPMTPRVLSPSHQEETPMTKLLRSEPCINFSMIVTPSLPPTPNIMISPCSENQDSPTSYASRPTDYSSCSSYYNPSKSIDTPTKLEQELIKECNKIEQSKKKAQDKVDKSKENLESISRNIAVDAKTSQDKKAEMESADFPKEVQSQLKDISTSQVENEPLNSNSSCFVTVSGTEEFETNNTEKMSCSLGQNIKVGQKDVEKTMKQASLENISGEKHCFITNLGQKKTVNAKNKLGEKVASEGQICAEGNKKVKDLSVQIEEDISKENKVENGLKTSETKAKDVPMLHFNDQSQCHTKDPEVSDEISVMQNSEKVQIPFQNEPIKSILQNVLEKGKGTLMKNKNTLEDPNISQDVHCEKSLCATPEEIPKHCEVSVLGGEADCDNTVEELISENHSHDSNKQSNSGKGSSKTLNTSSRKAKNDTQKNMDTHASAKREIGTIKHSTEMVSEIKEQFSKNEIKKKGKKSTQTQEKLSLYSTTNASDSSCSSNENEDNNVTGNADNENVAALKAQKIKNVSNVQINNKNNTAKIKNKHSNLQGTVSVPAKKTGRKIMEDVDPEENKAVTSRNVIRKHIGFNSSQINKNVNKNNSMQANTTNITPVKSRVERQKGMKRTPKVTEMVRYFVSKTPSKSPRSQALKSKNLIKKRIVHKESVIKKKTKPEDILSEKNGDGIQNKLNKVDEDSTIELRNETEDCEKRKGEKSSKKENEFVKSDRNSEKNEKGECIEITDRKNENKNVVHTNETETAHQENENVDTISDNEPSEKGKEVDRKNADKRSDEERKELQIQKDESVIDVHIHYDEVTGLNQEETMVSHKCESVNMNTESNFASLSSRTKTVLGNSEDIEKEQLENRLSGKENVTTSVNNNNTNSNNTLNTNRHVNCTSASEGTTSIEISQTNFTEVVKVSEIEQLPIKPSAILDSESLKQIDSSASVEVDYERQEETETSSSESDSDESSENSCSDSSDESSIDTSESQDSFVEGSDKETGLQEGNSTSLRDVTGDDILSSENQLTYEKGQQHVEESCSETINEILKTASSVSYISQDMCFASELCEKKKRTLARLKGSTETHQTVKITNNTANKDGEIGEVSVGHQPVRCEQNQVSRERRVEERKWDESSIEEFPVLHLSDSESAENATPILSPIKSLLMDDNVEKQKHNTTKSNAVSREISLKRIPSPAKDDMAHAVNRCSTEIFEKNCVNNGELKFDREVVSESESHQKKNDVPVIEGCSVPHFNPLESENTNCRDLESAVSAGDSIVESVMRMNENELFLKILYTGNFCPTPQAVNHTNFCYSLNEDDNEITIIGSQFQSLMEIPSKEICNKPNCVKHVKEQEIESTSSVTKTNSSIEGKIDNQELGGSISDCTISIEGNNKQSIKRSSKLRPLDALYEEMIRCNDSSSMSDGTDVFMEKSLPKSKELSTAKCTKKKTHQGSLKVSGSGQRLLQESMRYQSPLEMIPEYKHQKEERSSNYSIRSDSKIKDQGKSKKEANQSERKDKGELEEGEILDSPPKECTSSGSNARRDSSRYVYRSGYRRSESSDGSHHSYSSHRSKPRSSETAKRETYSHHHKNEKHQTSTASSHHDDVRSLPPKKRKAVSDETIKESEKRVRHDNPCKLLKNLNIDSFLNKVHGEDPCK